MNKIASPKWVKLLQAGLLSPESLKKITSFLPEGSVRQVKYLGSGSNNIADLMAGNIGSHKGLMVRKLPRVLTNLSQENLNNITASNIIDKKFPGLTARYLPSNKAKGMFQEYGTAAPYGEWPGRLNLAPDSEAMKKINKMQDFGIVDMTEYNFGPKGQLIDYMYKFPKGLVAGNRGYAPEIHRATQGLKYPRNEPKGVPLRDFEAPAIRKYWLGKKVPISGEEQYTNTPLLDPATGKQINTSQPAKFSDRILSMFKKLPNLPSLFGTTK